MSFDGYNSLFEVGCRFVSAFAWSHIPVRPELLNLRIQSVTVSESDCSGGADMRHIPFDIGTADGIC